MTATGPPLTSSHRPRFSVVIPTRGRRETVARNVDALTRQTLRDFEAIVVVDGDTDGTGMALRELRTGFDLKVIEQENRGAAEARNAGAAASRGKVLLFLDDDMEADPAMLSEHDRSHVGGADLVIGDMPLHPNSPPGLLSSGVGLWARSRRERLDAAGARIGLDDILTGQLSISRAGFDAVGGFDTSFTREGLFGGEDIDFGYRVVKSGLGVVFNPRAVSLQYYDVDPADYLRRNRETGRSEEELVAKHPEQAGRREQAPAFHTRKSRWLLGPLVRAPDPLVTPLRSLVVGLVRNGRQGNRVRRLFFGMRTVEYRRGALEARRRMWTGRVFVLAYHNLADLGDDPLHRWAVSPRRLEAQLDSLARSGWSFIDADALLAGFAGERRLPRRALMITFDDGYQDLLTEGCPILARRAIPAVVFAVAGLVGGVSDWSRSGGAPQVLLDEDGLKTVTENGIEVGSHAMSHRILPEVPSSQLDDEMRGSADTIQALGLPRPRVLAYPYGEWSPEVARAAFEAGYAAAFAIHPGVAERCSNRYALPRIEVLGSDTSATLRVKIATAGWPERLRSRLLRAMGTRA
jgi:glycosyltransferase involved in cell wall biosynthesis